MVARMGELTTTLSINELTAKELLALTKNKFAVKSPDSKF